MITLDSPVTTVLGDKTTKRKRLAEGLGILTVGRPAAALPPPLHQDRRAQPGLRPRARRDDHRRRRDRRQRPADLPRQADRPAGVPPRDGAPDRRPPVEDDVLRQEPGHGVLAGQAAVEGSPRGLRRPGQHVPRRVAADQPPHGAVRGRVQRGGRGRRHRRQLRRPLPDLPADQGRGVLGHPARHQLRPLDHRRRPRGGPRRRPRQVRRGGRAHGRRPDPRARHLRPGRGGPAALPLRGGAGHPGRPRPAAGVPARARRAGPHGRRRPPGGVRRAAAVRAHRRADGRSAR